MSNNSSTDEPRQPFYYSFGSAKDRRNQYTFMATCLVWAISFTMANSLLREHTELTRPLFIFLLAAPSLLGIGTLFAYRRFLQQTDELQRKIQTDAAGVALAAYLLLATGHTLLESAGHQAPQTMDLFTPVVLIWSAAQIYGAWRYR